MAHEALKLLGGRSTPLYAQLAEILRQRIERGNFAPGETLPSIEELMLEFAVARVTVRQAIARLAEDGLVSPQRGRGTIVTRMIELQRPLRVETTLAALVDMYRNDSPELLNISEDSAAPTILPSEGELAPRYLHMRRVHSRDGRRYCVISIYLDRRVFAQAPARFRREVVLPVLFSLPGIKVARAKQTLTIGTSDQEVADLIGQPAGSPVALVRRVLAAPDGTVVYLAEVTYRGDFICLEMDLQP